MLKLLFYLIMTLTCLEANAQTYIQGPNLIEVPVTTATAVGTTTLTASSKKQQQFTGSTTQNVVLPAGTALQNGRTFYITNRSTGTVTVKYNDATTALTLLAGNQAYFVLESNGSSNGTWDVGGTQAPLSGIGNLTDVGTDGITVGSGTGAVIGSGTTLSQHVADATHAGYLASADWNTFSGKQAALTFSAPLVNTTSTITCNAASGSQPGCLSSTDWTTFNGKQASGSYITALTGGVTASGPGSATATVVTNANLTGGVTSVGNAATVVTNANLTGPVTSSGNATSITNLAITNAMIAATTIDLTAKVTGVLPIANGGTNGATANAGFNNLSPNTTKGDLVTFTTVNARHAVPGDYGQVVPDSNATDGWRNVDYKTTQNGRPGKNYIQYADAENGQATGWTTGVVGTLTNGLPTGTPTFGSGASGSLAIVNDNSSFISGTSEFELEMIGANTVQGNMFASSSLPIDKADQAKVLQLSYSYYTSSGAPGENFSGTSSNSVAWAVYDVTNSSWLTSTGNFCMTQSSGVGVCKGAVQTNATTANIRLVVYYPNASTGGGNFLNFFDDFYLGPQNSPTGPAMTDWVQYTPTFSASWGSVTNVSMWSRRVGSDLEISGRFTGGTTTAATATMTIGYNGTSANVNIDFTRAPSSGYSAGYAYTTTTASTGPFEVSLLTGSATPTILSFGAQTSTLSAGATVNASIIGTGGTPALLVYAKVPIVGWSSNSTQSSDTDTRVVALKVHGSTGASMGTLGSSLTDITWNTTDSDTHGAYAAGTGIYTIPVTGYYDMAGIIATSGTAALNTTVYYEIYNLTTTTAIVDCEAVSGGAMSVIIVPCSIKSVFLTAGTQIKVRSEFVGTYTLGAYVTAPTQNIFSLSRVSGPAVITATESVNANYTTANTQSISNTATTVIGTWTKVYDSHNAFNASSGVYTVPVSGKYHVSATLASASTAWTVGSAKYVILELTGTQSYLGPIVPIWASITTYLSPSLNVTMNFNAGDTISVSLNNQTGSSFVLGGSGLDNWITIERVGN